MNYDKYFETYEDLFLHPGWKQFIEEMKEVRESYDLDNCKDYDSFLRTKSARDQLARVINFEELIKLSVRQQSLTDDELEIVE